MQIREKILARLAAGDSLRAVCSRPGMPTRATVRRWQAKDADFRAACERARERGSERVARAVPRLVAR